MTEAEVLELIVMYIENSMTGYSIWLTVTFAFMTVAYFVGEKLTPFQVWAVSGLYLIGSTSAIIVCYIHIHAWSALRSDFPGGISALDTSILWNGELWKFLIVSSLILGNIVSLYFMYNVRRSVMIAQSPE